MLVEFMTPQGVNISINPVLVEAVYEPQFKGNPVHIEIKGRGCVAVMGTYKSVKDRLNVHQAN